MFFKAPQVKKDKSNEINLESKKTNQNIQLIKNSISKEDIEHFVSAIVQFGTENTSSSSLLQNANLLNLNLTSTLQQQPSSPSSSTTSSSNKLVQSPQLENQSTRRQLKEDKITLNKDPVYVPPSDDEYDNDQSTNYEPLVKKKCPRGRKKADSETNQNNKKIKTTKVTETPIIDNHNKRHHRHHHYSSQYSDESNDNDNIRQCSGPNCTETARNGSKYCSDDCGFKLAKKLLFDFFK